MEELGNRKYHYLDVVYAQKYGACEALVLHNIIFWVSVNRSKAINFRKGKYWMYCSLKKFANEFNTYFTVSQIRTILESLRKHGVILVGNYNKSDYVNPNWYTIADESMLFDWGVPKDRLDIMNRKELKKFIYEAKLNLCLGNMDDKTIAQKIREELKEIGESKKYERELDIKFPEAESDWYCEGDDDDKSFGIDKQDELDELDFYQSKEFIKSNKLQIKTTKKMDVYDIRRAIRFKLNRHRITE